MFDELTGIDTLDGNLCADELVRSQRDILAAEARQFQLTAHWADLHAPAFVRECLHQLPGMPRVRDLGIDGCPEIEEFAAAELAALLGRSRASGEQLVRDAVAVRHRHPLLWAAIGAGEARVWMASRVARRCASVGLTQRDAIWVDAATTPYISTLPPKRFFDLVEAMILQVDPDTVQRTSRGRFVTASRSDEDGMRTLAARADAGDIVAVVAVIERIASILADQGSTETLDSRRATALRVLANPARALTLLLGDRIEAHDDGLERSTLGDEDARRAGEAEYLDVAGESLWGGLRPRPQEPPATDEPLDSAEDGDAVELFRSLARRLADFDSAALDPLTVFHVHLSGQTLADGQGVVRVEGLGPSTLAMVRDWLTHPCSPEAVRQQVQVRPVLDLPGVAPVDRYEIPPTMVEAVAERTPYEIYPFGTLDARRSDKDHTVPYDPLGPPGQTAMCNLGPLGRTSHRIKTHGGWFLRQPDPADDTMTHWWRTRHGHWFRVDVDGTHHHGRDPDLDSRWLSTDQRAGLSV